MLPSTNSLGTGGNTLITLTKPCDHQESPPKKCMFLTKKHANMDKTEVCVSVIHDHQKGHCVHTHYISQQKIIYGINYPQMPTTKMKPAYCINYAPTEAWVKRRLSTLKPI